jgi:hypothetical protein
MLVPQTSPFEQGGTIWASAQLRALQLTHGPEIERARQAPLDRISPTGPVEASRSAA